MQSIAIAVSLILSCTGNTQPIADDAQGTPALSTVELTFSTWHPETSVEVQTVWKPMLALLEERSQGRIKTSLRASGALGAGPDHYQIVKDGLSDFGYFTATWTPGQFPRSDVLSVASAVDGKEVAVDIGAEMLKHGLESEFKGVHVLELNGCIQAHLWTRDPVDRIGDLNGLKVRSPGGLQTSYIRALGAEPVFMPLPDVYQSLKTGAIDGIVTCPPLFSAFNLHEVLGHGISAPFGCVTEGVVMNEKVWASLPKDLQLIVEEVAGNPYRSTGGLTKVTYSSLLAEIRTNGVVVRELRSDETVAWEDRFQSATKEWAEALDQQGQKGTEIAMMYKKVAEQRQVSCPGVPTEWHK